MRLDHRLEVARKLAVGTSNVIASAVQWLFPDFTGSRRAFRWGEPKTSKRSPLHTAAETSFRGFDLPCNAQPHALLGRFVWRTLEP